MILLYIHIYLQSNLDQRFFHLFLSLDQSVENLFLIKNRRIWKKNANRIALKNSFESNYFGERIVALSNYNLSALAHVYLNSVQIKHTSVLPMIFSGTNSTNLSPKSAVMIMGWLCLRGEPRVRQAVMLHSKRSELSEKH